MKSPEYEPLNYPWPNLEVISDLKNKRHVRDGSPFWWSTDYGRDPREYLPFERFRERLVYFGNCRILKGPLLVQHFATEEEREVYLYPEPVTPITILNLEVGTQVLPFLVTARPYHESEIPLSPWPLRPYAIEHPSLETLPRYIEAGEAMKIKEHFYPHIRGLFAGKRGTHFFWYPLSTDSLPSGGMFSSEAYESNFEEYGFSPQFVKFLSESHRFGQQLANALEKQDLSFLGFYNISGLIHLNHKYSDVWRELERKKGLVDQRRPLRVDFTYREVSAEKFLEDYQELGQDLLVYYPLRLPGLETTLPLVIATRTHKEGRKKPAILGIFADNGAVGRCRRAGILRIKNRQLARSISQAITVDFGIPVDAVLFISQKGRPRYERITP